MNPFYNKDIITIRDFKREDLELLFKFTDTIITLPREEREKLGRDKILGYLFFEPSTRTRLGFEVAMAYIGGTSLGIANVATSSIKKGESLKDTIRVMDNYADIIVIRHNLDGSARFAAEVASKPVINAGSGMEEHPTQAMLDLYTILKKKGRIDGLRIGIVGDLKYSRTVYSLIYGLDNYDVKIDLISPKELRIRKESISDLRHTFEEYENINEVIHKLDVIYVTRLQRERFVDEQEYLKVKGSYSIDKKVLQNAKEDAIVMHPLPRVDEIKQEVDNDKRGVYFEQVKYGKYVKAALLALIFNKDIRIC